MTGKKMEDSKDRGGTVGNKSEKSGWITGR